MSYRASRAFWRFLQGLPPDVQRLARENYELLKRDARHPSLRLKRLGDRWSVRVGRNYRAVGVTRPYGILWVWIGPHDEYDRLFT